MTAAADISTTIQRKFGLSAEDADRVIALVASVTMTRYLASQADAPPPATEPSTPAPIVVNVYVDERVREGIMVDVANAMNDATQMQRAAMEV